MSAATFTQGMKERLEELAGTRKGDPAVRLSQLQGLRKTLSKVRIDLATDIGNIQPPPDVSVGEPGQYQTWWDAITDAINRVAQAEEDYLAAMQAVATVNQDLDAATLTLNERIDSAGAAIDAILLDLDNNYPTNTVVGQTISDAITAFGTELDGPDGSVGQIRADLETNYLTGVATGEAIAAARTELKTELVGGNLIRNPGTVDAAGWVNVTSTTNAPSNAAPGARSLTVSNLGHETPLIDGDIGGRAYRLRGWVNATQPVQVLLRGGTQTGLFDAELCDRVTIPATDGWQFVALNLDPLLATIRWRLVFETPAPFDLHAPTLTEIGTIGQAEAALTQEAFTLSDANGALAALRQEITAEYSGAIGEGAPLLSKPILSPADFSNPSGYSLSSVTPGPFAQASAVRMAEAAAIAAPEVVMPARIQTLLTGQRLRIDVLVRRVTATSLRVSVTTRSGALANLPDAALTGTEWQWISLYHTDATTGSTPFRIFLRARGGEGVTADVAHVLVRTAAQADEIPVIGTLSGNITDVLALDLDAYTGSALATLMQQLEVDADGVSATVTQQGAAIADVAGEVSALYKFEVKAGSSGALLQLVAADGEPSVAQIEADFIDLKGRVSVDSLVVGLGGNQLQNTDFRQGLRGWKYAGNGSAAAGFAQFSVRQKGISYAGVTYPTLQLIVNTAGVTDGLVEIQALAEDVDGTQSVSVVPVNPGDWYEVSAQIAMLRGDAMIGGYWRDVNGTAISAMSKGLGPLVGSPNNNPDAWARQFIVGQAPPGAAFLQPLFRMYNITQASAQAYLFLHKPMVCKTHALATEASPYDAGATTLIDANGLYSDAIYARHMTAGSVTFENAAIANAAIDTLQLRGQAVTVEVTSERTVPLISGSSAAWRQFAGFTVNRIGGIDTRLHLYVEMKWNFSVSNFDHCVFQVRILRNGASMRNFERSFEIGAPRVGAAPYIPFDFYYFDTNTGSGSTVYTYEFRVMTSDTSAYVNYAIASGHQLKR